jgi:predicted nucleic acid-binding protein
MIVYVDGSALSRYLIDLPGTHAWRAWAAEHEPTFVTTPLGLFELRRVADQVDPAGRAVSHAVRERISVIRFSDQTIKVASMAQGVLTPFAALHLGAASSHPDISALVTYDRQLARVAAIYGLSVVTPGALDGWWEQ